MRYLALVLALAGCKSDNSALEKRVNTLAADVAELQARPTNDDRGKARQPSAHGADPGAVPVDHDDHDDLPTVANIKATAKVHAAPHWTYEGEAGPTAWSQLDPAFAQCASGRQQSPIDIVPHAPGADPPVLFVYKPTGGEVVDNGHTLQINLAPGSFAMVDDHRYDLVQFHIHTPSEHTIAHEALPMEVHLVHKDKAGKLAVVGVIFAAGEASTALAPMWKAAPPKVGSAKLKLLFDPNTLLPLDRSAYRYDGSLTTPPCSEGVEWIVLRRIRTETPARIASFHKRFGGNARPIQELGARVVE